MASTLAGTVEEIDAPGTTAERDAVRSVVRRITDHAERVVLRFPDGGEYRLDIDELRILLAIASARANGQRVSVVGHDVMLSPQQAADLLGVSRPMVYRFIERGDLEGTRVGTHWRLKAPDVLALAEHRARLIDEVDSGFERVADAMADRPEEHSPEQDAKTDWRSASDEQRETSLARVRRRAEGRRE